VRASALSCVSGAVVASARADGVVQDEAHAVLPAAVRGDPAVAVEDHRVAHVFLGGDAGHVLLERGVVVEQHRAVRHRGEVAREHRAAALELLHDARPLPVLDEQEHRAHDHAQHEHGRPEEPGLQRPHPRDARDHRGRSSQTFRKGM
jgi:hypothetical protein